MLQEILLIFFVGLALMLLFNFAGRRFVPGMRQSPLQLLLISVIQAVLIVILIVFLF
ncbi:hypothetical protein [Alkalicoccus saliphilus]|jgi:hypothetical protein|uniref:hypothetical protein n=1 Tax=Alkalicoccus saliphilus TaxID=200989 RepID=UPI00135BB28E|nr:hypothetical protein [Alkalicoccus saliphilus]